MNSILVVDDDPDILDMVNLVLTTYELRVSCISSGAALLPAMEEYKPDLVLMDIYLGDADGRNLCSSLKTSAQYKHIPVILYSAGHITTASVKESMADDFLAKPFDNLRLINKIRSLL
jgi:DNA-binding response OmpR family regulator